MSEATPSPAEPHPLVDEATKKAAVAWVAVGGGPGYAVWCVPLDGALYVVTGPGEQSVPGLADTDAATVTLRGDHGGRIVTWPARVSRLGPDDPDWPTLAPAVAGKRLNAPGPTADLVDRWAAECVLSRLVPAGPPLAAGESLPHAPLTAPPRPSPATRPTHRPFHLHRLRP